MTDRIDQRAQIAAALTEFDLQSCADAAKRLFATLGYKIQSDDSRCNGPAVL
jgi:hypothetical protein